MALREKRGFAIGTAVALVLAATPFLAAQLATASTLKGHRAGQTGSTTTVPSSTSTTVASTTTTVPATTSTTVAVSPATGTVYSPPQSIVANCSGDVAPALYAWISSLPNGTASNPTVVSFPSTACYQVEETLPIWQKSWLTIQGNGAKFEALTNGTGEPYIGVDYGEAAGPHYPYYMVQNNISASDPNNSRAIMLIDDSTNVSVQGVHLVGPNTCADVPYSNCYNGALESQAGFIVSGGSNISLSNNVISQVWGDCAQVGSYTADGQTWLNGFTFSGNKCDHLGRHGWSSSGGQNFQITGNTFTQVAYDAMDMEDDAQAPTSPVGCVTGCSGAGWANVTESGNTFTNVGLFSIAVQCGPNCTANNISFNSNSFSSFPEVAVYGLSPDPYVQKISITGNQWAGNFMSSNGDSVNFQMVNGLVMSGNTIAETCYDWSSSGAVPCPATGPYTYQQPVAVSVEGSSNVAIQNNNVAEAAQVLEVDSNNNGQTKWTGTASSQVTQCGNTYGSKAAPITQPGC